VVSLADLRGSLVDIVESHLLNIPRRPEKRGFETFYFCEAHEVTVPFGPPVSTLEGLAAGIRLLGHQSLHYHSSIRACACSAHQRFSHWISANFHLPAVAARLDAHRFL